MFRAADELEPALAEACARARAAAPGVNLDERVLAERLAATLAEEADPVAALAELHVEDLFVAIAAARGDRAAIERIDQRVRREVAAVTRSHGASGGFADDLESEVRALVLAPRDGAPPRIGSYAGRGPLDGWLRVTATREALRLRKRAERDHGGDHELEALAAIGSPELDYLKAAYRDHFRRGFAAALRGLDDRQRNLIRLHYGDGVGVERLGQIYRVHFSTISRWIAAARRQLFEATRAAVREQLAVSDAEFEQLMDLVRSRLDVTISLLVRPAE
ncbi:MAG: sigma-70 family RNA polymerase sigma factor [Kofleriaceae bacterium]